jgi:putative transposase
MIIQENLSNGLHLSIAESCQALEVSRCGYYKWINQQHSDPFSKNDDVDLRNEIQEIVLEFPG